MVRITESILKRKVEHLNELGFSFELDFSNGGVRVESLPGYRGITTRGTKTEVWQQLDAIEEAVWVMGRKWAHSVSTWTCKDPNCGFEAQITYKFLSDQGTPECPNCGRDLVFKEEYWNWKRPDEKPKGEQDGKGN